MARMISLDFRYGLQLHEGPAPEGGWRARLAHRLRTLAARLDGDRSLRYRVETLPCLSMEVTSRCLDAGIKHAGDLLLEACRAEALEGAMRIHKPELYADETHNDPEGRA
jgi:hypothetical protein